MKASEAEQLVCPFMSDSTPITFGDTTLNGRISNCITTKCTISNYGY